MTRKSRSAAKMIRYVTVALALVASIAWADKYATPTLRQGSGYESSDPAYRVVGMEDRDADHTLWVVAATLDVLNEQRANRIIADIQKRNLGFTTIRFYSSVKTGPAFAGHDHLAAYDPKANRVYYGVGAKNLQGAWAYGPRS